MKILIPDTLGSRISPAYRALLPDITFRGIDHPEVVGDNQHGAWCGWLAGAPLQARGIKAEIVFLQILSTNGTVRNWADLLLDTIEREQPDVVSCSWGAWDGDDDLSEIFLRASFSRYVDRLLELKAKRNFILVCASGNDDNYDEDMDVAYPQKLMPDNAWIIGATDPYGVPMPWSGDGFVDAVMIGSKCASPGNDGNWELWQGTSAACPKFAGMVAAMGWSDEEILSAIQTGAQCPAEWAESRPHTKWGWGSMEFAWQNLVADLPEALKPPLLLNRYDTTYENWKDGRVRL
jgi:hypothetical protein